MRTFCFVHGMVRTADPTRLLPFADSAGSSPDRRSGAARRGRSPRRSWRSSRSSSPIPKASLSCFWSFDQEIRPASTAGFDETRSTISRTRAERSGSSKSGRLVEGGQERPGPFGITAEHRDAASADLGEASLSATGLLDVVERQRQELQRPVVPLVEERSGEHDGGPAGELRVIRMITRHRDQCRTSFVGVDRELRQAELVSGRCSAGDLRPPWIEPSEFRGRGLVPSVARSATAPADGGPDRDPQARQAEQQGGADPLGKSGNGPGATRLRLLDGVIRGFLIDVDRRERRR